MTEDVSEDNREKSASESRPNVEIIKEQKEAQKSQEYKDTYFARKSFMRMLRPFGLVIVFYGFSIALIEILTYFEITVFSASGIGSIIIGIAIILVFVFGERGLDMLWKVYNDLNAEKS